MQQDKLKRFVATCLMVVALIGAVQAPASAAGRREERMHGMINAARAAHGVKALRLNGRLSRVARNHSRTMAQQSRSIFHSCLACTLKTFSWSVAGENVGEAPRLARVHRMFMASAHHRGNILRKAFRAVGVGVVRAHGRVWVTQIFIG